MGATAGMILTGGQAVNSFVQQQDGARAIERKSAFDAKLADLNAADAISRGNVAANQQLALGRRVVGAQRAGLAASGIDANTGTAADLQADESKFSALDAQMIRNNAAREAWGYKTQSQFDQIGARQEADNERAQSYSTLLTGAANTYGLYRSKQANRSSPDFAWRQGGAASPSQMRAGQPPRPRGKY